MVRSSLYYWMQLFFRTVTSVLPLFSTVVFTTLNEYNQLSCSYRWTVWRHKATQVVCLSWSYLWLPVSLSLWCDMRKQLKWLTKALNVMTILIHEEKCTQTLSMIPRCFWYPKLTNGKLGSLREKLCLPVSLKTTNLGVTTVLTSYTNDFSLYTFTALS